MKPYRGLFLAVFLSFCFATQVFANEADKVDAQGRLTLDVVFTYQAEDSDIERWKRIMSSTNLQLSNMTGGQVQIKKVNLFVCPLEVEEQNTTASADITVYKRTSINDISLSRGTLTKSRMGSIDFYDGGESIVDASEVLSHEMVHYLFETVDEYAPVDTEAKRKALLPRLQINYGTPGYPQLEDINYSEFQPSPDKDGVVTFRTLQQEVDLVNTRVNQTVSYDDPRYNKYLFRFFCSETFDKQPDSCIMDGIPNFNGQIEYYSELCSPSDHCRGVLTLDENGKTATWTRNGQEWLHGISCQTRAKNIFAQFHSVNLTFPDTPSSLPPDIEFEVQDDCSETVVLLLDKSGSMSGGRLASLKRAAAGLIDSLDDSTKLGIVWFDSQPTAAVGIQELKDSRELAKQAIFPISASGGTRIGFGLGVAYQQITLFRDPDEPRTNETIFLVTDGESSDDTATVLETIANDGVKINPIALGEDADLLLLSQMAARTGGDFYFSADDGDIVKEVTQGATKSLESYTLVDESVGEPSNNTIPFQLDGFMSRSLVQIELNDVSNAGDIEVGDLEVVNSSGNSTPAIIRITELTPTSLLLTIEINEPEAGLYELQLPADSLTETSSYSLLLLTQSDRLHMSAGLQFAAQQITYPNPAVIQMTLSSNKGTAHELPVKAIIRRPDGSTVEVSLRDDGSLTSGDDLLNDGLYSFAFQQYNGNGVYQVEILADNSENVAYPGAGMHTISQDESQRLGSFRRIRRFNFELTDYSAPQTPSLTLSPVQIPDQTVDTTVNTGGSAVVLQALEAEVGEGQEVIISRLDLNLGGTSLDLDSFTEIHVFVDSNRDGLVDFSGPTARPLGVVEPERDGDTFILRDVVKLEPNSEQQLLIVGIYESELPENQRLNAGLFWFSVPLLVLLGIFQRMRTKLGGKAKIVAVSCLFLITGCGGGSEDFVFSNTEETAQPEPAIVTEVQSRLELTSAEAVGAIDGAEIDVQVLQQTPSSVMIEVRK